MQRSRSKMSLGDVYRESFSYFVSRDSLIIFLVGIIIFSLLYSSIQHGVGVISSLPVWNASALSSMMSSSGSNPWVSSTSAVSSYPTMSSILSNFGSWMNMASSLTSFSIAYLLIFFAVALLEVLVIRAVMSKKLNLPVRSYINLLAMSVVLGLFIELPIMLTIFYGFSLMASINSALGIIISVLASLFALYIAVRVIFAQIYAAGYNQDPITSIESSFNITKGKFWFVFGTLLIPLLVISLVISLVFGLIAMALPAGFAVVEGIMLSLDIIILTTILTNYLINAKSLLK